MTSVSFSLEFECLSTSSCLSSTSSVEVFFELNCQLGIFCMWLKLEDVEGVEKFLWFNKIPLIVSISFLNVWRVLWRSLFDESCVCFCLFISSRTLISSPFMALVVLASSSILSPFFLRPNKNGSMYFYRLLIESVMNINIKSHWNAPIRL